MIRASYLRAMLPTSFAAVGLQIGAVACGYASARWIDYGQFRFVCILLASVAGALMLLGLCAALNRWRKSEPNRVKACAAVAAYSALVVWVDPCVADGEIGVLLTLGMLVPLVIGMGSLWKQLEWTSAIGAALLAGVCVAMLRANAERHAGVGFLVQKVYALTWRTDNKGRNVARRAVATQLGRRGGERTCP